MSFDRELQGTLATLGKALSRGLRARFNAAHPCALSSRSDENRDKQN
ncbi:hypothetical protein BRPE64_CCDS07500 [Caballeronia insecticola]|uniref:Uncharacterized protein n=1 Tax=Caballeronia insecticola TaxID=758793 RepID=R4WQ89_9BURK|nr:hypothetical protein BRPE64_CCDS07500 [Caballeronia insecticola]